MKNIIQVGSVTAEFGGEVGGISTHLIQLSKELSKKKYQVTILSDVKNDYTTDYFNVVGIKKRRRILKTFINSPFKFVSQCLFRGRLGIKQLIVHYEISKFNVDDTVIHVHSLHNELADQVDLKYKKCYSDHGFWQKDKFNAEDIKAKLNNSHVIISVSSYARDIFIKTFGEKYRKKSKVIYNPVTNCENKKDIKLKRNREFVFFNGYSESIKRKGFLDFCKLAKDYPNEKFVAVADKDSEKYAEKHKISNLTVYGRLSLDEIFKLYSNSKLMVLPSKSESFGIVYIESAMHGVPFVGFSPVVKEFNKYSELTLGYEYDPNVNNYIELKNIFELALKADLDAERMQQVVRSCFSWEHLIENYTAAYES
ncbi:glycosyltransferase family 4 protein [Photobacterium sp. SP02]|uniref:glycosyltransferase family 4 protein n=1 Tax=Photobacterium sp. SP02 TaxID=3032280 RepID=UPI0031451E1C